MEDFKECQINEYDKRFKECHNKKVCVIVPKNNQDYQICENHWIQKLKHYKLKTKYIRRK